MAVWVCAYVCTLAVSTKKIFVIFLSLQVSARIGLGLNVSDVMDEWVRQPGHPVVMVTLSDDRTSFTLRQQKFLIRPEINDRNSSDYVDE